MATKHYYSTEEAIQIILAPASDSELSDIELSDDDGIDGGNKHESTFVKPRLGDDAEPDDEIEDNVAIEEDTAIADNDETIRKDQDFLTTKIVNYVGETLYYQWSKSIFLGKS